MSGFIGGGGGGGSGDVTGAASSTANAIVRFSGTGGKTLLNTGITIDDSNDVALADGTDIAAGETTGTKIGTASTQKLGFYGVTPVDRPDAVAAPSGGATIDTNCRQAVGLIITRLQELGLLT